MLEERGRVGVGYRGQLVVISQKILMARVSVCLILPHYGWSINSLTMGATEA